MDGAGDHARDRAPTRRVTARSGADPARHAAADPRSGRRPDPASRGANPVGAAEVRVCVPSLLSVPPDSFFGFLAPADGCFARRVGAVIAVRSGPLASGSATEIASPGHPSAGPPRPRNLQRNEKCDRTAICSPPAEGPLVSSNETSSMSLRGTPRRRENGVGSPCRRRSFLGCVSPQTSLAPGPDLQGSRTVASSTPVRISVALTEAPGRPIRWNGIGGQAKWEHDARRSRSRRW